MKVVLAQHRGRLDARSSARRAARYQSPPSSCCSPTPVQSACGIGRRRGRAVLLPARPQGLPRPRLLRRARRTLRRARRLRAGLRDRPRGRPPRAEPARHLRASVHAQRAAAPPRRGQRAVASRRAAGRLLRRRLGAPRRQRPASCSSPATSRRRCSAASRDRRRHAADAGAQGRVVPESFTHGSSAQRVRWFKTGMASGRVADCDTLLGSRRDPADPLVDFPVARR